RAHHRAHPARGAGAARLAVAGGRDRRRGRRGPAAATGGAGGALLHRPGPGLSDRSPPRPTIGPVSSLPSPARGAMPWIVVLGIVLAALTLRRPFTAPAPLLGRIRTDVAISAAPAGLLTTLPVLCFAVTTPLAARVVRRAGPELAVVTCLLGVLAGTV